MTKRIIEVWGSSQRYKMHRNSQKGIYFEKTDLSKEKVQVGNSLNNYIEETYPIGHCGEFVYERDRGLDSFFRIWIFSFPSTIY